MRHAEDATGLEYNEYLWGDHICGRKAEIQALGIAQGLAFPGEIGGPRRKLRVQDPRGLVAEIERASDGKRFCVRIPLPDREPPDPWLPYADGVQKRETTWSDCYRGSAEALVSAGLARLDQFPGRVAARKTVVRIGADGAPFLGPRNANPPQAYSQEGAKIITVLGKTKFTIDIFVGHEEHERRFHAWRRKREEWEARMAMLPRPAPLVPTRRTLPAGSVLSADEILLVRHLRQNGLVGAALGMLGIKTSDADHEDAKDQAEARQSTHLRLVWPAP